MTLAVLKFERMKLVNILIFASSSGKSSISTSIIFILGDILAVVNTSTSFGSSGFNIHSFCSVFII